MRALYRLNKQKPAQPGSLVGYARVSTDDQDCAAQVWEFRKAGCTEIVQEYGSGTDKHRPALARLFGSITAGDTLIIVRLDRLARSLMHLTGLLTERVTSMCSFYPRLPLTPYSLQSDCIRVELAKAQWFS